MRIFGLMMVRNEADIIRLNLCHHLAVGLQKILVVDNGSTDGTSTILEDLSRNGRVERTEDAGPYHQSEITTSLAREAWRQGADWVVAIDADEFWCAPGRALPDVLAETRAGALEVEVLNFIQRRSQLEATPESLLHMTRRTPLPIGPREQVRQLVEEQKFSYVETMYSTKWICRPSEKIEIAMGNHGVSGVPGPLEQTDKILCLHAGLRARSVLDAKVVQGARVESLGLDPAQGWHVRRWNRLALDGDLEREWRANSYEDDGLDVYGERHPVVFDPRLRDLVAPLLDAVWKPAEDRPLLLDTIQQQIITYQRERDRFTAARLIEIERRDRIIQGLQKELQEKVGQRDRAIADLQLELLSKTAERDRRIMELTEELLEKVGQRDGKITDLQAELVAKVGERDRIIVSLQHELLSKVSDRDQRIERLTSEVLEKVSARDATVLALNQELMSKVGERDQLIVQLQTELHLKVSDRDRTITRLQAELQSRSGDVRPSCSGDSGLESC